MRNDLILEDTTLRDGEQAPGLAFTKAVKLEIHDRLVDAGVRWIEAGIPAMGGEELDTLRAMLARGSDAVLVAWNRGIRADVAFSLDLGFKAVHIGLPASDVLLRHSVGRDRRWLLEQARELISFAKDRGAFVSISAEDVGRSEIAFLQEYAAVVAEAGADRLRLSDTIGILTPAGYAERVAAIRRVAAIDLQCHAHNDYGLAVANTLAGLEAGARYFHVTVGGVGERAGMPDLAQVAFGLKHLYKAEVGIVGPALPALYRAVAAATAQPILPWQPIVGSNVFAHESGIHINAMLRDATTFEPLLPEEVGASRRYTLGKHSGRALVRRMLVDRGIQPSEDDLSRCLERARAMTLAQRRPVEADQLLEIYHEQ